MAILTWICPLAAGHAENRLNIRYGRGPAITSIGVGAVLGCITGNHYRCKSGSMSGVEMFTNKKGVIKLH